MIGVGDDSGDERELEVADEDVARRERLELGGARHAPRDPRFFVGLHQPGEDLHSEGPGDGRADEEPDRRAEEA